MKVELLKQVLGIGNRGDIKDVKIGYAQNFLVPGGLAKIVDQNSKLFTNVQGQILDKSKKSYSIFNIRNKEIVVSGKVNEQGTLYKSIDKSDIEKELRKNFSGICVHSIKPAHLKSVGKHNISIVIDQKIKTNLVVAINGQK